MPYRDHPDNILGVDSADNLFASTLVTANADGSIIERLEALKDNIASIGSLPGNFVWGIAPSGTNSTTAVAIASLAGYGDDFFNHEYFMQIIKNSNSATNAPEKQVRQITDYVSATGTFTVAAFGAAIEASDICLIMHESVVALGRDDNDNTFATTNVAANADGSILERLEYLQSEMGAAVGADLSADIAAIKAQTDEIGSAAGASIAADIAAVLAAVGVVDDYIDTEVVDIKTATDKIGTIANAGGTATIGAVLGDANNVNIITRLGAITTQTDKIGTISNAGGTATIGSAIGAVANNPLVDRLAGIQTDVDKIDTVLAVQERCLEKADGAVLNGDDDLFVITGGPILITEFVGVVTTVIGANAANCTIQEAVAEPAGDVALSTAVDITDDAAGTSYTFTAASPSVLTPTTAGAIPNVPRVGWVCPIGTIQALCTAANTGNIKWYMTYKPLSPSSVVTVAV